MSTETTPQRSTVPITVFTLRTSVWTTFLLIVWAAWWGGLCFYAIVVVPIGTELIGSVEQGFITQRVTRWHNVLTGIFLVCLIIQAFREHRREHRRVLWSVVIVLTFIEIGLVVGHWHLTGMMDFESQSIPGNFYAQHAIYLWITAAEWLLGMAMPIVLLPVRGAIELR